MTTNPYPSHTAGSTPQMLAASSLLGYLVRNEQDEELGQLVDLMLDTSSARLVYVVLAVSQAANEDERLLAIPWAALQVDVPHQCLRLNLPKSALSQAPLFLRSQWPTAEREWHESIHRFFGTHPYWESTEHYTA